MHAKGVNMDVVILKDFEVKACHGVNPDEKINPQRFVFTAEIFTGFSNCAKSDDLTKTISYSDVKKTLKSFCENNCFDLIETLAVRAAKILLKKYPLASKVKLTVKKPDAPMSGVFEYAGVRVEREWKTVYLALGSSMGDKGGYLDFAMERLLANDNFRNVKESARIVTKPYGGVAKNDFVNSVVKAETLYSPQELLATINAIENDGDRVRLERWGDRTLDIDIVFYGDEIVEDDDLCVPHIDMQNRYFVLAPLVELCPNKLHPVLKKRVKELYVEFTEQ